MSAWSKIRVWYKDKVRVLKYTDVPGPLRIYLGGAIRYLKLVSVTAREASPFRIRHGGSTYAIAWGDYFIFEEAISFLKRLVLKLRSYESVSISEFFRFRLALSISSFISDSILGILHQKISETISIGRRLILSLSGLTDSITILESRIRFRNILKVFSQLVDSISLRLKGKLFESTSLSKQLALIPKLSDDLTVTESKLDYRVFFGNSSGVTDLFSYSLVTPWTVETRYKRGDTHTVNLITAYKLGTTQSTLPNTFSLCASPGTGAQNVYWGIRIFRRQGNGNTIEIGSSGTYKAQVSRDSDGEGIQSATWVCPETTLDTQDAIQVVVYQNLGGWTPAATFVTEQLGSTKLATSTWTVYYYTRRYYDLFEDYTCGFYYWGDSTYDSRIENFKYRI